MLLLNTLQNSNNTYNYVNTAALGSHRNMITTRGFLYFKNHFKKYFNQMLSIVKKITLNSNYSKKENITFYIHKVLNPFFNFDLHASMGYLACRIRKNFSHILYAERMHSICSAICNVFIIFHNSLTLKYACIDAGDWTVYFDYYNLNARLYSKKENINIFGLLFLSRAGYFFEMVKQFLYMLKKYFEGKNND